MGLPVVPELAVSVRSDSSFPRGSQDLFAGEEGVCVRGAFASQRSQISLVYLFATTDGAVSGGAASEALAVTLEASQRVLVDAYQVDRPGTPYRLRHVPASTLRQLSTGEHWLEWATFVAEEEPFDPSKLERITFRTSGAGESPFEVCISKIQVYP